MPTAVKYVIHFFYQIYEDLTQSPIYCLVCKALEWMVPTFLLELKF